MFRNPFKYFTKYHMYFILILLVLFVANRLLLPYRSGVENFFDGWILTFQILFGLAFLNKITFLVLVKYKDEMIEEWGMSKQPQSVWKKAYLETVEDVPKKNIWVEKAIDIWVISLLVSMLISLIGGVAVFLFSLSVYSFVIILIGILIFEFFPKLSFVDRK